VDSCIDYPSLGRGFVPDGRNSRANIPALIGAIADRRLSRASRNDVAACRVSFDSVALSFKDAAFGESFFERAAVSEIFPNMTRLRRSFLSISHSLLTTSPPPSFSFLKRRFHVYRAITTFALRITVSHFLKSVEEATRRSRRVLKELWSVRKWRSDK